MKFITTIYGNKYIPMLWAHLQSIKRHHPKDIATVFYGDVSEIEIWLIKSAFPNYNFIQNEISLIELDLLKRIPLKLTFWKKGCDLYPDEHIALLDCDTLLSNNLNSFIQIDVDIIFTWKEDNYPLNTGVIILKSTEKTRYFMDDWLKRTKLIIEDPVLYEEAINGKFGTADQQALADILKNENYKQPIEVKLENYQLSFSGVNCKFLNETRCRTITEQTYIIHYKSSWHPVLIESNIFSRKRPQKQCKEMYNYWQFVYRLVNRRFTKGFSIVTSLSYLDHFKNTIEKYEERGILNSEMLLMCSIINALPIDVIVESGRYRGQSTEILAKNFPKKDIISIELNRDEIASYTEDKLSCFKNLKLLYGDTAKILPNILQNIKDKNVAILFDGPKGRIAIDLFKEIISRFPNVIVGFFHDMKKSVEKKLNPGRSYLENSFERIFFTDDKDYVEKFQEIDRSCLPDNDTIEVHDWSPWKSGTKKIGSYGPTLAIVIPVSRERIITGIEKTLFQKIKEIIDHQYYLMEINLKRKKIFRIVSFIISRVKSFINKIDSIIT